MPCLSPLGASEQKETCEKRTTSTDTLGGRCALVAPSRRARSVMCRVVVPDGAHAPRGRLLHVHTRAGCRIGEQHHALFGARAKCGCPAPKRPHRHGDRLCPSPALHKPLDPRVIDIDSNVNVLAPNERPIATLRSGPAPAAVLRECLRTPHLGGRVRRRMEDDAQLDANLSRCVGTHHTDPHPGRRGGPRIEMDAESHLRLIRS
mmetsp:Transcript_72000/g.160175  ORF Transcript_72000/g.160175 Transcript_72000/m.160175 type:complete len:205 (+) Transcript_72000:334-948(+)